MGKVSAKSSQPAAACSSSRQLVALHRHLRCRDLGGHGSWREFALHLRQRDHRPVNTRTHVVLVIDTEGFGKNFPKAA